MLGGLFGRMGTPLYPAYLLLQPLIVLGVVMLIGTMLRHAAPGVAEILSGGRLKAERQASSRVAIA